MRWLLLLTLGCGPLRGTQLDACLASASSQIEQQHCNEWQAAYGK